MATAVFSSLSQVSGLGPTVRFCLTAHFPDAGASQALARRVPVVADRPLAWSAISWVRWEFLPPGNWTGIRVPSSLKRK